MSMFAFFQTQRQLWLEQPTRQQPEVIVGGMLALDQAEAAFQAQDYYNPTLEAHRLQQELDELQLKLQRQHSELQKQQTANQRQRKQLTELQLQLEKRPKWGGRARRHLRKLDKVANDPHESPENRFYELVQLIGDFLAEALAEQAAQEAAQKAQSSPPLAE